MVKYQPLHNYVLIKTKVKEKSDSGIILPYNTEEMKDMLNTKKQLLFEEEIVAAVGDKVESVEPNDQVRIKKRGAMIVYLSQYDMEKADIQPESDELYYLVEEEFIIAKFKK